MLAKKIKTAKVPLLAPTKLSDAPVLKLKDLVPDQDKADLENQNQDETFKTDKIEFVLFEREVQPGENEAVLRSDREYEWEIPGKETFDAVLGQTIDIFTEEDWEFIDYLSYSSVGWNTGVGMFAFGSDKLSHMEKFRTIIRGIKMGNKRFESYPKRMLLNRYALTIYFNSAFAYSSGPKLLSFFKKLNGFEGDLTMADTRHYPDDHPTRKGCKIVACDADQKFLGELYKFPKDHAFSIRYGGNLYVRGGERIDPDDPDAVRQGRPRLTRNAARKFLSGAGQDVFNDGQKADDEAAQKAKEDHMSRFVSIKLFTSILRKLGGFTSNNKFMGKLQLQTCGTASEKLYTIMTIFSQRTSKSRKKYVVGIDKANPRCHHHMVACGLGNNRGESSRISMIERKKGGRKREPIITNDEWYIYLSMKNVRYFYVHTKYKILLSKYLNLPSFLPELVEKLIKRAYKKSRYAIKTCKLRLVQDLANGKRSNKSYGLTGAISQLYTGKKKDKLYLTSCKLIWCEDKQGKTPYVLRKFECSSSKVLIASDRMYININYETGNDIGLLITVWDKIKSNLLTKLLFTGNNVGKTKQRHVILDANGGNYGDFNARSFCRKRVNYLINMKRNNSSFIHFEAKKGRSLKTLYGKNTTPFETKRGRGLKITYGRGKMYKLWEGKITLGSEVRPYFGNIKGTFYKKVVIYTVGNNYRMVIQEKNYLKSFSIINMEEAQQYSQFKVFIHNYDNVVISTRNDVAVITAIKVVQYTVFPKLSRLSKIRQNTKGKPRKKLQQC